MRRGEPIGTSAPCAVSPVSRLFAPSGGLRPPTVRESSPSSRDASQRRALRANSPQLGRGLNRQNGTHSSRPSVAPDSLSLSTCQHCHRSFPAFPRPAITQGALSPPFFATVHSGPIRKSRNTRPPLIGLSPVNFAPFTDSQAIGADGKTQMVASCCEHNRDFRPPCPHPFAPLTYSAAVTASVARWPTGFRTAVRSVSPSATNCPGAFRFRGTMPPFLRL